jgi:hypothetical protein
MQLGDGALMLDTNSNKFAGVGVNLRWGNNGGQSQRLVARQTSGGMSTGATVAAVAETLSGTNQILVTVDLVSKTYSVTINNGTPVTGLAFDDHDDVTELNTVRFLANTTLATSFSGRTFDNVVVSTDAAGGNTPPVADAGTDQSVQVGDTVALDGSGSSDADGDPLTFLWESISAPAGSTAALTNPTTSGPTFVPDVAGSYDLQLVVNDGTDDSAPDTVTITAAVGNTPPVADAGENQNVQVGDTVNLDGSGSSDPDGDDLTYDWTLADPFSHDITASLSDPTAVMPTFSADQAGIYEAILVVNDGTDASAPDTVAIIAAVGNSPPVADAGTDQSAQVGETVALDGSGSSDADGDPLTFLWEIISAPAGSTAALTNPTTSGPTFVPDVAGSYDLQLVANDGTDDSAPDTVTITAAVGNTPPVADAGENQSVQVGDTVNLDGNGSSDPDGDDLTYDWTLTDPLSNDVTASLSDPTAVMPTFLADQAGIYEAILVVNDGTDDSAPDTVAITAAVGNTPPVVDAGADHEIFSGEAVTINITFNDPDGDDSPWAYTINWGDGTSDSGSTNDQTVAIVTSHQYFELGDYTVEVCITDTNGGTGCDSQVVTVKPLPVGTDIKPGGDPNPINCKVRKGVIPVAILTTGDFDATTVNHATVVFEGASETHVDKKTGEPRRHEEDVDGDGDKDLTFHFLMDETSLTCASTEGALTGKTFDGRFIVGSDSVRMVAGDDGGGKGKGNK